MSRDASRLQRTMSKASSASIIRQGDRSRIADRLGNAISLCCGASLTSVKRSAQMDTTGSPRTQLLVIAAKVSASASQGWHATQPRVQLLLADAPSNRCSCLDLSAARTPKPRVDIRVSQLYVAEIASNGQISGTNHVAKVRRILRHMDRGISCELWYLPTPRHGMGGRLQFKADGDVRGRRIIVASVDRVDSATASTS